MDSHPRLVGDYQLIRQIGTGSFAVVWLSQHTKTGFEFAVKEIDKKKLNPKVCENLFKEISILSTINHPNIIRLFESFESESKDRIYLVLEYCSGGDLADYIHRRGRVSQDVARHFMTQLAAGLLVLQENKLIHRDLKPQNLLLSSKGETPQLKIGDFGFARSLKQGLADTLCGSPLYMAPEIMQNKPYDAKADLWSVGAILFHLITGKTPFDGRSAFQLFQNVFSTELQFPEDVLEELHPDCVDLCRNLLRLDPVSRLTFNKFFNHKFLREPRLEMRGEQASFLLETKSKVEQFDSFVAEEMRLLNLGDPIDPVSRDVKISSSSMSGSVRLGKVHGSTSGTKSIHSSEQNSAPYSTRKSVDGSQRLPVQSRGADLVESIEKGYVLVNRHCASMDNFSYYSETSLQGNSPTRVFVCPPKKNNQEVAVTPQTKQRVAASADSKKSSAIHGSDPSTKSLASSSSGKVQVQSRLHPSAQLDLLSRYVQSVAELAQEKHDAGLYMESFSVELVVLAIWKKALQICGLWLSSTSACELPDSSPASGSDSVRTSTTDKIDLSRPSSAYKWAEQEFLAAYDQAEKLSFLIKDMDATAKMPDAMEIIFKKALAVGTSGAVDEYMENKDRAATLYSKAMLLLSFVVEEAESLPLNPPFLLTPANKKRIQNYIMTLQSHRSRQSHY